MTCRKVIGRQRGEYLDLVWEMYVKTYGIIGMHLNSPKDLLEYDLWELCGNPICAFSLWKVTKFGLKAGLGGSDKSPEGKAFVKSSLTPLKSNGARYAEVSHAMEHFAEENNLPAVCSSFVLKVLGKNVDLDDDGVHYFRNIGGLGKQRKILVGRPLGVPTTSIRTPSCSL